MTRAVGCDLSRYDISFDPNKASGAINFAFQKGTEGISYVDLKYEEIWQGLQRITVRGFYHYQRSGLSWLAQADHALKTAARHDYQILALDVEEVNNTYNDTFFADTKRIIDRLRAVTDKKVVLYTNGSSYDQLYLTMLKLYGEAGALWLDGVPLWIASPTTAAAPILPRYRTNRDWLIHQHSWTGCPSRWGTGGTRVDENVFCGDVNMLWSCLHMAEPSPTDDGTETENSMALYEGTAKMTATPNVRVRKTYPDGMTVGAIQPRESFCGDKIEQDTQGRDWMHVTEVGGDALTGWAAEWLLEYQDNGATPPPVEPPAEAETKTVNLHLNIEVEDDNGVMWGGVVDVAGLEMTKQ